MRSPLLASRISLMDLSRPTVMGITTPGKSTVLRSGSIGNTSGTCSLFISASSSDDISGKNSESSFIIGKALLKSYGSKLIYAFLYKIKRHVVTLHCALTLITWYINVYYLLYYMFQDLCQDTLLCPDICYFIVMF